MRFLLVAALLAVVGCGAWGVDSASGRDKQDAAVAAHNEKVKDERERLVCTRETPTGSNFAKRICRTVAQIEEEQERVKRDNRAGAGGSVDMGN